LFNDGSGVFSGRTDYSVGDAPEGVSIGDLDGDGDLDIIVSNRHDDDFSVLFNDGSGVFSGRTDYSVGDFPKRVSLNDFDGDGDLDLSVTNMYDDDFSVYFNDGSGVFSGRTDYSVGDAPISVKVIDLNSDGDLDIIITNWYDNDFSVLFNYELNGSKGPCCGDDADSVFRNSTTYCYHGSITEPDSLSEACEAFNYYWLTGSVVGNNTSCCGDDGVDDDFYNATNGYGGFCTNGDYYFGDADDNEDACSLVGSWLSGATGSNAKCCGDDGAADDFGNETGSCCCNGVVVASGTECDLDGDGNIDAKCENGNLPETFISESTYNDSYVTSDYSPSFLLKNTGNETICVTNVTISNISLPYTVDPNNPDCIQPGNSGLFVYHFGGFDCDDLDKEFNPVLNITYRKTSGALESIIRYLHFIVKSPLDITSISPEITTSLPVAVNGVGNFLMTVKNQGTETVNFNITAETSTNLLMFLELSGKRYTPQELTGENFTLGPGNSMIINVKVVPTTAGEKTATITFTSIGECSNVTDTYTFQVTGFTEKKLLFNIYEVSSWDFFVAALLIIIPSIILYRKLKKQRK